MKEKSYKFNFSAIIILLIFSFFNLKHPVIAQSSTNSVCIVGEPDATTFPDVTVKFRVLDQRDHVAQNLNQSQFKIIEEGKDYNPSIVTNSEGTGLNLYFVIDRGNRTDAATVKAVMTRFAEQVMINGLDRVSVVSTDFTENATMRVYGPDTSKNNLQVFANNLSSSSLLKPLSSVAGIRAAINNIRADAFGCSTPNIIVVITGPDVLANEIQFESAVTTALETNSQIYVIHTTNKGTDNQEDFEDLASKTNGLYIPASTRLTSSSSTLDDSLFPLLNSARYTYEASYRAKGDLSGQRNLSVIINNVETASQDAKSSYTVKLAAPLVTIKTPIEGTIITRSAVDFVEPDFIYNVDTQKIEWDVSWPDTYSRDTESIKIFAGQETLTDLGKSTNYQYEWDLKNIKEKGSNALTLRVEVVDELGMVGTSDTINVVVTNFIPEELVPKDQVEVIIRELKWPLYALYGFIGLLLILALIFRKRLKYAFSAKGAIGNAIENVRKTIVGGRGHRRSPIAKLEVLRPTQETKSIFTESVKLGRDPNLSDYTFFSLNSECSVSGEHAHLVKKRDGWVIIGVSSSKSPVFVDGKQINLHEEIPLANGQIVELGYEDLGSALFRFVEIAPAEIPNFFQSDGTGSDLDEEGYRKTQVLIREDSTDSGSTLETNVLAGELDSFNEMTKDQDDFDLLFDDLRGKK